MKANPNPRNGSENFNPIDESSNRSASAARNGNDMMSASDKFFQATCEAVSDAGCELLLEVPTAIFDQPGDRAVAIRNKDARHSLCFLLLRQEEGVVSVVTAAEAPQTAIEFTQAYVNVLSLIAGDRKLVAPLLQ